MKRVSKLLSIAAMSLAMTGTALADDPPKGGDEGGGGDAGAGASAGGSATVGAGGATVDAGVTAGVYTKETWPKAGIDRPLTAAKGMIEATPLFTFAHISILGTSANAEGAAIQARYGISDKLELGVAYSGIQLNPNSEFKGNFTGGLGFALVANGAGGKLDAAAKAAFSYGLLDKNADILAGVDVRYKVTPKIFIGTPINTPGLRLRVVAADVAGMSGPTPITFAIPFAAGIQATPELQVQVSTQLASFSIKDSANVFISDITPLTLDAIFALSNKLDVKVLFGFLDLQHAGDFITIGAGVNVRL